MFFCKWFKHDQTSNVIWLSTTWLLIFQLEDGNKKPLFTTKSVSIWLKISCSKYVSFYSYKFCIYLTLGCHIRKMLFANASRIIREWFLALCESRKSFIKIVTVILYLKLQTLIFGRFGILTWRVLGGWVWNLAWLSRKLWEDSIFEWTLEQAY